jgi:hypothetical protein
MMQDSGPRAEKPQRDLRAGQGLKVGEAAGGSRGPCGCLFVCASFTRATGEQ